MIAPLTSSATDAIFALSASSRGERNRDNARDYRFAIAHSLDLTGPASGVTIFYGL